MYATLSQAITFSTLPVRSGDWVGTVGHCGDPCGGDLVEQWIR